MKKRERERGRKRGREGEFVYANIYWEQLIDLTIVQTQEAGNSWDSFNNLIFNDNSWFINSPAHISGIITQQSSDQSNFIWACE